MENNNEKLELYKRKYEGKAIQDKESGEIINVRIVAVDDGGSIICYYDIVPENNSGVKSSTVEFIEKYYAIL